MRATHRTQSPWRSFRNQNDEGNEQTPQEMENVPVSGPVYLVYLVYVVCLVRRTRKTRKLDRQPLPPPLTHLPTPRRNHPLRNEAIDPPSQKK